MITVSTATMRPESWVFAPAPPLTAVFESDPLTTMPLRQPRTEVGRAETQQLAVRVDLVVRLRRVGLGGPEALGEPDEDDPDRSCGEVEVVVRRDVRQSQRREAGVDVPDEIDAVR